MRRMSEHALRQKQSKAKEAQGPGEATATGANSSSTDVALVVAPPKQPLSLCQWSRACREAEVVDNAFTHVDTKNIIARLQLKVNNVMHNAYDDEHIHCKAIRIIESHKDN